ncbi:gp254 [Sphingomonas phage PAU]|uniref:ribonucleotide reductase class Ia beta subunit n=1 Tax=Sphingomonas phage PAU TaxID=1150991 RepID=UPI0002573404|nr:ribonucleotide reductase class Ia beta subunit [Sphingomonas phage PAU]AFF28252.1 gp254 [Sphingomonas phage PAU]
MTDKKYTAVNWNNPDNDYAQMFWDQNIKQFWIDTEYVPSNDITSWKSLEPEMKKTYMRALGGLTLLDTLQSHTGMPKIIDHIDSLQNKAVLSYMCMMEAIHAKSYSTIFTTVANKDEIDEIFSWITTNPQIQYKASVIDSYYQKLANPEVDPKDLFMGLAASVMLESFLFYSGFFLPLYLSGNGKMKASADIIKKIVADESIHGVFVGLLAQEVYNTFDDTTKKELKDELLRTIYSLYENEAKYTDYIYTEVGLSSDVKEYVKYNANKALMNLGFDPEFTHGEINPIVLNGLNTETTQHDFFSMKSTNYEMAINVKPVHNEDFELDLSCPI